MCVCSFLCRLLRSHPPCRDGRDVDSPDKCLGSTSYDGGSWRRGGAELRLAQLVTAYKKRKENTQKLENSSTLRKDFCTLRRVPLSEPDKLDEAAVVDPGHDEHAEGVQGEAIFR